MLLYPYRLYGSINKSHFSLSGKDIAEQLDHRQETYDLFASGIQRFLIGLGKKVLIANNVGLIWSQVSAMDPATLPLVTAWLGILAFTLQIYFDFSGYSDMAIGLGRMFGFEFLENFNYPYIAKSITEFWRRWHISLSTDVYKRQSPTIPKSPSRRTVSSASRTVGSSATR